MAAMAAVAIAMGAGCREPRLMQPDVPRLDPHLTSAEGAAVSDAQILEILARASTCGRESAKLAASRARDSRVKAYAERARGEYDRARETEVSMAARDTIASNAAKLDHPIGRCGRVAALSDKKGTDFDRAYMATEAASLNTMLARITQSFLPTAHDAALVAHLNDLEETAERGAEYANELQRALPPPA
jgi:predicted outer membrane protein